MINLKEIIVAVVITVFIFMGTLFNWSPFRNIIQFGNKISDSYAENVEMSNIPDAEKLSLKDFAKEVFNVSYSDLVSNLEKFDFDKVDENSTVIDFCNLNDITPEEFYLSFL